MHPPRYFFHAKKVFSILVHRPTSQKLLLLEEKGQVSLYFMSCLHSQIQLCQMVAQAQP